METKFLTLVIYTALGIFFSIYSIANTFSKRGNIDPAYVQSTNIILAGFIFFLALFAVLQEPRQFLPFITIGLTTFIIGGNKNILLKSQRTIGLTAGFCVSGTLLWWRRVPGTPIFSGREVSAILALSALFIAIRLSSNKYQKASATPRNRYLFAAAAVYVLAAILLSFSTGIYSYENIAFTAWHHWGAYVGPAQVMQAGAVLFRDIPAQYGFGPTALALAACTRDCWLGMYYLSTISVFLYGVLIAILAIKITNDGRVSHQILSMFGAFACAYLWSAYPPLTATPAFTPSVSGLRFLPVLLMVAHLVLSDFSGKPKTSHLIGHGLWIVGVIWSPESAFYVTFVWWPIYLWARCLETIGPQNWVTLFRSAFVLIAMLMSTGAAALATYWVIYRTRPTLIGYFAYMIHPPGDMPVNFSGAVLFLAASIAIGTGAAYIGIGTAPKSAATRRIVALLLASYACSSYFIGRSHDNNILNLLPFIFLLLLASNKMVKGAISKSIIFTLTTSLSALPIFFNWSSWQAALTHGKILEFKPDQLITSLSFDATRPGQPLPEFFRASHIENKAGDAAQAIEYITQHFHEPVTALDQSLALITSQAGTAWSAIQGPANFTSIPSNMRRHFLSETMHRLHKPGWLLIAHSYPASDWIADFDAVYRRDTTQEFDTYYAIRYLPQ